MTDTIEIIAPKWNPSMVAKGHTAFYRGLFLTVDEWGWTVAGTFAGYRMVAVHQAAHPTTEDRQAAVAAADDLLSKGLEPS